MSRPQPMTFTYDRAADALSIELLPDATSARMVQIAPDCNADLDKRGRLVSIEILQASAYYSKAQLERLERTSDELTLREAAEESDLAATTLKNQIRAGKLPGVKRGRDWFIERAALWNYLANRSPAGRPSNASRKRPGERRTRTAKPKAIAR